LASVLSFQQLYKQFDTAVSSRASSVATRAGLGMVS